MKRSTGKILGFMSKTALFVMTFAFGQIMADSRLTRDIILDIDYTLTACCDATQNNFIGTFTALSALEALVGSGCSPVLITQASVGTTGLVITQSGVYQLTQSIVFSPAAPASAITIAAPDVLLNLECFSIEQGNGQTDVRGVEILSTFSNITIVNGSIGGMTSDGIRVGDGTSNITISDMQLLVNGSHGIFLNGTSLDPVVNVQISGLELLANGTGITSNFVQQAVINECSFFNQTSAGIELISSYSHVVKYCLIADTSSAGDVRGISAVEGGNNSFQYNIIDNTSTSATSSLNTALGILIGSTENNDVIMNNEVTNSNAEGDARPANIAMAYTFTALSASNLPTVAGPTAANSTVNEVDWTPDGRYLATASGNSNVGTVAVYEYDGTSLMFVATTNIVNANTLSWSPDGSFVAVGDSAPTAGLGVYAFNGVAFSARATVSLGGGRNANSVDWSSDGRFIAVGLATVAQVAVYEFSANANTLTLVASVTPGVAVATVNWSPDGNYLAVGTTTSVIVYSFNGIALTSVATFVHGAQVNEVEWSPDGRFIAMGGAAGTGGFDTRVLNFTGAALTSVADYTHGATVQSTRWSQDGQYVLLGGAVSGGIAVRALQFLGTGLVQVASFANSTQVNTVKWAPTGAVVAFGSAPVAVTGISVRVLTGLQFGSGSIIRNNIVTLAQGAPLAAGLPGVSTGRGLIGSSAANLIIQNTALSNDINYIFVTDVYRQYVANTASQVPSLIANLSFPPF